MTLLTARVRHAERMMIQATGDKEGIEVAFADGCTGVVPFSEIPEVGGLPDLTGIELPNPYQVSIRGSRGSVELPWDFVRHYCDPSYRPWVEAVAGAGRQSLGDRIRGMAAGCRNDAIRAG